MVSVSVDEINAQGLLVTGTMSGLTPGTRYDLYRMRVEQVSDDPTYERVLPDRKGHWATVGHRYGWEAVAATEVFRDYEAPSRPYQYFVVETTAVGPGDYDWSTGVPYPVGRGALGPDVVDLARARQDTLDEFGDPLDDPDVQRGQVILRSTAEIGLFAHACLYDLDEVRYTARGSEHLVMGRQYPLYVADTREARRGRMTLITRDMEGFEEVRGIVFPHDGRVAPVAVNAGSGDSLLLDDMLVVPLDVSVQHASKSQLQTRFVEVDFVEIDPTTPLVHRSGDNPDPTKPVAAFSRSPGTVDRGDPVTFTDTSTGAITSWKWDIRDGRGWQGPSGPGPYTRRYYGSGKKTIKLRVTGPAGSDTTTRTVKVR